MTVCCVRHPFAPAAVLALAVAAVAIPARAQQHGPAGAAPVTLAPPQSLAPQPLTPSSGGSKTGGSKAGTAATGEKPVQGASTGAGDGIKVDTLKAIDPNSVGLLDESSGGFGVTMWRGTSRKLVERLLPALAPAPQSAVARMLFRRLLLTAAETPSGPASKNAPSLLATRIGRLLAEGDVVSAQGLLRVVPQRLDEEAIARDRVQVAFLMNNNAGACAEVRNRFGQYDDTFWAKTQVFCQLLAGDGQGASVGIGLLQEQDVNDAPFYALARILGGEKGVAVGGLDRPGPLDIAMMRAAHVQIPPSVVADGEPDILRTVALSPNADIETRLAAAEKAEQRGALDTGALRQLYLSVNFTPDEVSNALSAAKKLSPARGRALLYQAVHGQTVASAQAEILARAFALARTQNQLPLAIRVFLPVLRGIEPGSDLAWFATDAASALYYGGAYDAAAKWYQLAKATPDAARSAAKDGSKTETMPADVALWPLAALATLPVRESAVKPAEVAQAAVDQTTIISGSAPPVTTPVASTQPAASDPGAGGFDEAMFERWWKAMGESGDAVRFDRAARLLAMMEAMGVKVSDRAWARLVDAPTAPADLPPVGVVEGLERAAAAGRTGETVLLALTALGAQAPATADPRRVAPVVKALAEVGQDKAARALAIEAVFGTGV